MNNNKFVLGEIAVFKTVMRKEAYITQVRQTHIDYPGLGPTIRKATIDEKKRWYENGEFELIISEVKCPLA